MWSTTITWLLSESLEFCHSKSHFKTYNLRKERILLFGQYNSISISMQKSDPDFLIVTENFHSFTLKSGKTEVVPDIFFSRADLFSVYPFTVLSPYRVAQPMILSQFPLTRTDSPHDPEQLRGEVKYQIIQSSVHSLFKNFFFLSFHLDLLITRTMVDSYCEKTPKNIGTKFSTL